MLVRKFRRAPSVARYSPTNCSTRRPISLRGAATGVNCIVALRVTAPGLSMPRVTRVLGTRSPPVASYLGQLCPTATERSVRASLVRIEQSLFKAVPLRTSCLGSYTTVHASGMAMLLKSR